MKACQNKPVASDIYHVGLAAQELPVNQKMIIQFKGQVVLPAKNQLDNPDYILSTN